MTPRSVSIRTDLDPAELELLHAMAGERPTIDVELAACFLVASKLRAARMLMLIRLERLGFLVAGARGTFALNREAYKTRGPREPVGVGRGRRW